MPKKVKPAAAYRRWNCVPIQKEYPPEEAWLKSRRFYDDQFWRGLWMPLDNSAGKTASEMCRSKGGRIAMLLVPLFPQFSTAIRSRPLDTRQNTAHPPIKYPGSRSTSKPLIMAIIWPVDIPSSSVTGYSRVIQVSATHMPKLDCSYDRVIMALAHLHVGRS